MGPLVELMKGYWQDKKAHPWHRLYRILEKEWDKTNDTAVTSMKLMLLREGVFGALGILSLSLPLDSSTGQILRTLTRAKSWKEGRRKVRGECARLVTEMISSGDVVHLVPSGLRRDGFGFIVPELSEALVEQYRKAEPKARKGQVNLARLSGSVLGRHLLREHMITERKIAEDDPRFQNLSQEYEKLLVEMELDDELVPLRETLQITLNGKVADEIAEVKQYLDEKVEQRGVQVSLDEFLEKENRKKKPRARKSKSKPTRKKRSRKGGKS
jgi:hypothetical protein